MTHIVPCFLGSCSINEYNTQDTLVADFEWHYYTKMKHYKLPPTYKPYEFYAISQNVMPSLCSMNELQASLILLTLVHKNRYTTGGVDSYLVNYNFDAFQVGSHL